MKGLEHLEALKNGAEVKNEEGVLKLVFKEKVKISDSESVEEFEFTVPTLEDIEIAIASTDETDEELRQMKHVYALVSSQFSPKIAPNEISKHLKVDELKAFSKVLEPFLS